MAAKPGEVLRRCSPQEVHLLREINRAAIAKYRPKAKQGRARGSAGSRLRFALGIVIISLSAALILWVMR